MLKHEQNFNKYCQYNKDSITVVYARVYFLRVFVILTPTCYTFLTTFVIKSACLLEQVLFQICYTLLIGKTQKAVMSEKQFKANWRSAANKVDKETVHNLMEGVK